MKINMVKRSYGFENGFRLQVIGSGDTSLAYLYNEIGNEVLNMQVPKLTERMGIVKKIEGAIKHPLNIRSESLLYNVSDAIVDGEVTELQAAVTPFHQRSWNKIEIYLFQKPQEVMIRQLHYISFTAYKSIEEAIRETIAILNKQIVRQREFNANDIVRFNKRIIYYNNKKYRAEVHNNIVLYGDGNENDGHIVGYEGEKEIFKVVRPDISFYERSKFLSIIEKQFDALGIKTSICFEELEFMHRKWGVFRVTPDNDGAIIKHTGLFNLQKRVDVKYSDYEAVMNCINGMIEEIARNPLKYTSEEYIGDYHSLHASEIRKAKVNQAMRNLTCSVEDVGHALKGLFTKR